jgi:hypothetical protein
MISESKIPEKNFPIFDNDSQRERERKKENRAEF